MPKKNKKSLAVNKHKKLQDALQQTLQPYIKHLKQSGLAVGVSGGADSMALVLAASMWAKHRGIKILAVHVDHKLRATSTHEAKQVKAWLEQRGIAVVIKTWRGQKPITGVSATARDARYRLLTATCKAHGIQHMVLAHHLEDQAETVLLRMARQSGLDGLAGIQTDTTVSGVHVLRPFLGISKQALKAFLQDQKQVWIEDPTNQNPKYTRAKIRQNWSDVLGALTPAWFANLAKDLRHVRDHYEDAVDAFLDQHAQTKKVNKQPQIVIDRLAWHKASKDVQARVLKQVLQQVGGNTYPPRSKSLAHVLDITRDPVATTRRTLAGCVIKINKKQLFIWPESGKSKKRVKSGS